LALRLRRFAAVVYARIGRSHDRATYARGYEDEALLVGKLAGRMLAMSIISMI